MMMEYIHVVYDQSNSSVSVKNFMFELNCINITGMSVLYIK